MPETLDWNALAATLIESKIDQLAGYASTKARGLSAKFKRSLGIAYKGYLSRAADHYGRSRTFFVQEEAKPLYDYYVPLGLESGETKLANASVMELEEKSRRVVVTGLGGSGKSTLMRHLFLGTLAAGKRIPIFVELRRLNDTGESVAELLFSVVRRHGLNLDREHVVTALLEGDFAIFFDGLDEVDESERPDVARQVRCFAEECNNAMVVLSSRPDDQFVGWDGFQVFKVMPLTLEKALELVEKLPFNEGTKEKFANELKRSLFENHRSFLSNPLLLSIMLLSYGQSASIPKKLSLFYNHAYEALFQKHDAYKGGFSRDRKSNLDIQEFEKVFSAFCVLSYGNKKTSFSRTEALKYLDDAKQLVRAEFVSRAVLEDLLQAVCLLMHDGLQIAFVHRSFQEYFAAKYIQHADPNQQRCLLDRFGIESVQDNVLHLLFEMDPVTIEDHWLIPKIEVVREQVQVKRKVGITHHLRYLRLLAEQLLLYPTDHSNKDTNVHIIIRSLGDTSSPAFVIAIFVSRHYSHLTFPEKRVRAPNHDLRRFAEDEAARTVATSKLTTRSPVALALANADGIVSRSFLEELLQLPGKIEKGRSSASKSLQEVLGIR